MDALPTSADIERLLDHVRVAQNDSGAVQELITEAIEYVKRGKGKEVHRFCSDGGAPPDFELQTCMLRLFSFKRKGVIAEWIDGLAEEYGTCVDCYKGFVAAKENLRAR